MFLLKKMQLADREIEDVGAGKDKARLLFHVNHNMMELLCEMQDNFPGEQNEWHIHLLSVKDDRHAIDLLLQRPYNTNSIEDGRIYVVRGDYISFEAGVAYWIEFVNEM